MLHQSTKFVQITSMSLLKRPYILLCCALIINGLHGCSLFPDKEKQYLQHTELDSLVLPDDLRQQRVDNTTAALSDPTLIGQQVTDSDNNDRPSSADIKSQIPVLVDLGNDPIHIRVFKQFDDAWREIGKTLTHMGLEVLDRDIDNKQFFIVYEKAAKPKDDSLWSYIAFWKDDGQHEEFDFRVKLVEEVNSTHVFVLNSESQPVSEGPGRTLLYELYQAL